MVRTGLSDEDGSWKIIEMRLPRTARRPLSRSARDRCRRNGSPRSSLAFAAIQQAKNSAQQHGLAHSLTRPPARRVAPAPTVRATRRSCMATTFEHVEAEIEMADIQHRNVIPRHPSGRAARSPSRLKPGPATRMPRPGNTLIHHRSGRFCAPSATIGPSSGVGACTPRPRKPSEAAVRMTKPRSRVIFVSSDAMQFGRISTNRMCASDAPSTLAATTYPWPVRVRVMLKINRAYHGHHIAAMASMALPSDGGQHAEDRQRRAPGAGTDRSTSVTRISTISTQSR